MAGRNLPTEAILGFQIDSWDYVTFAAIAFLVLARLGVGVFVLGLPGRIAIARKHPKADAVNLNKGVGGLAPRSGKRFH